MARPHSISLAQSWLMRVVIQRVTQAAVTVADEVVGAIGPGLCLLVGVGPGDDQRDIAAAVEKICGLRIFGDDENKMNRSLADVAGEVLVVSQFTLLGDASRGRRPSFVGAAPTDVAAPLIETMISGFADRGVVTASGVFGAKMSVALVNDGPVTMVLEFRDGQLA